MIRDAERFAKLASGVQSIVIAVAVVVGGGWSFYTFNSQLQVQNARAQLTKLQRDIEADPRVELELDVAPIDSPSKERRYFFVGTLVGKNVGTTATTLQLQGDAVRIYKVVMNKDGAESWTPISKFQPRMDDQTTLGGLLLQVGATNRAASFIIAVETAGLYVAVVSTERNSTEIDLARAAGAVVNGGGRVEWGTQRYFVAK